METQIPQPIIHVFKEVNKGKYSSVRHYELSEVKNGTTVLSNKINISKNRNFALSMPDYWLKIRQGKKWSKWLTGLFKTETKDVYKGDIEKRKHLVLFKFIDTQNTLIINYYPNYYTTNINGIIKHI